VNRDARDRLSIRSPLWRQIAKIFLIAMVIVYLVFISYSYHGRLDSPRSCARLAFLWCLGAVAVALVTRSWQSERKSTFEWLDRAWSSQDSGSMNVLSDPFVLRYKDDPRFAAFCRKVGLPVPGETSLRKST
jgi:hypothetical protein